MRYPAKSVSTEPSVLVVGGNQVKVTAPVEGCGGALTVMEKAGNAVLALPSLTLIVMPA